MRLYVYKIWEDRPAIASHRSPPINYRYASYDVKDDICLTKALAETNLALLNKTPLPDYLIDTYQIPF